jgi:hypothetical protein
MRAVALMPPTTRTTKANHAGYRHPPWRTDRAVRATSHGRAAKGRRMTEMRAA